MTATVPGNDIRAGTVAALLADARAQLAAAASDTAALDAQLLLAHVTGLTRAALIAHPEHPPDAAAARKFAALVVARATGVPVAYLVGRQDFHALTLNVTPDVLVPRPETELVVDELLERRPADTVTRVLDLGTGSGAIALAVAHARPGWRVTGVDVSPAALDVAAGNAARLGLAVHWRLSSWFDALAGERFELIACNPPYVASDDAHFDGPLAHEPRAALDGGPAGLAAFRRIFGGVAEQLTPGGRLVVEHGATQRARLTELADAHGLRVLAARDDLAGLPRVLVVGVDAP